MAEPRKNRLLVNDTLPDLEEIGSGRVDTRRRRGRLSIMAQVKTADGDTSDLVDVVDLTRTGINIDYGSCADLARIELGRHVTVMLYDPCCVHQVEVKGRVTRRATNAPRLALEFKTLDDLTMARIEATLQASADAS